MRPFRLHPLRETPAEQFTALGAGQCADDAWAFTLSEIKVMRQWQGLPLRINQQGDNWPSWTAQIAAWLGYCHHHTNGTIGQFHDRADRVKRKVEQALGVVSV